MCKCGRPEAHCVCSRMFHLEGTSNAERAARVGLDQALWSHTERVGLVLGQRGPTGDLSREMSWSDF